jgi:hypothetical protein
MPSNGHAAALRPAPSAGSDELERIGEAVANAVFAVLGGCAEWDAAGALGPTIRARAGDSFVELYRLQEMYGGLDFDSTARREGKRVLLGRYGDGLRQQFAAATLDAELDEIVGWPLGILARVTAIERALAH